MASPPKTATEEGSDEECRPLNNVQDPDLEFESVRENHGRNIWSVHIPLPWVLLFGAGTILTSILVTALLQHEPPLSCYPVTALSNSSPPPRQAPTLKYQVVVFEADTNFLGPPTAATEASWQSLLPVGRGFVYTTDAEGESPDHYSIAAFHQYHCVHLLQRYFHQADQIPGSISSHDREHFYHCLEYVRQTVICHADPSLDRVEDNPNDGDGQRMNSGWGDAHVCRDFGGLRAWAEKHRYTNATYPDSF